LLIARKLYEKLVRFLKQQVDASLLRGRKVTRLK